MGLTHRPPVVIKDNQLNVPVIVNNDSVPVFFTPRGTQEFEYNEVSAVGLGTVNIIQMTVPVGQEIDLSGLQVSGDNIAVYKLMVNGSDKIKLRTYYTEFNAKIDINNITLTPGEIVTIEVENKSNVMGDFNATLFYSEVIL